MHHALNFRQVSFSCSSCLGGFGSPSEQALLSDSSDELGTGGGGRFGTTGIGDGMLGGVDGDGGGGLLGDSL